MFLKYFLIGLGGAGVVGVGGYAVYHEVSKKNMSNDAKKRYGESASALSDGRVTVPPSVDSSVKNEKQKSSISPK